ncbi:MAG TPA: ammonium transporter [Polyangiaceae bacterium]|nr:ammonium transporter [Polyangiaceae bacterium]
MSGPTLTEVAKQADQITVSANIVWTLVTGFLVMFMQAGFALVETGLTRSKNVAHTMAMNFLVYAIGILGFWIVGFGLEMGGVGAMSTFGGDATLSSEFVINIAGHDFGLFGTKGFFLTLGNYTPAVATMFFFQMVFMDTTATVPTGAMAERWKFISFVIFSFVISTAIYPIYANWVWGGGWLSQLGKEFGLGHGHVDFAGSSVVHMTGGVAALVGAKMLGPRIGKYNLDGSPNPIPGHNIPMALLGAFILAFGWFGFNPGSTLSGNDTRIAIVAVNTMLASAAGAFSACVYVWTRYGKPDPTWLANGMLAGLVAITAPCAFVGAPAAVFIGGVAGVLVVASAMFVEQTLKIDDPVGASSVHGACGTWGVLALGLFANGTYGEGLNGVAGPVKGFLFSNDGGQLLAECIGIAANFAYVGTMAGLTMYALDKLVGNRVSADDEIAGLDVPEMGVSGYTAEPGTVIPEESVFAPTMTDISYPPAPRTMRVTRP